MTSTEAQLKAIRQQIAALTAAVGERNTGARAQDAPVKKKAVWETVEERRFAGKGKVGRFVAHARFAGVDFVTIGKLIGNGKDATRGKTVAVRAADLKAALADFDL